MNTLRVFWFANQQLLIAIYPRHRHRHRQLTSGATCRESYRRLLTKRLAGSDRFCVILATLKTSVKVVSGAIVAGLKRTRLWLEVIAAAATGCKVNMRRSRSLWVT